MLKRRDFIRGLGATGILATFGVSNPISAAIGGSSKGRVVVIGGGFGGATCAKYIRKLNPDIEVTLVEADARYITCPFSNLVLAGLRELDPLTFDYQSLRDTHGIRVINDTATAVDPIKRRVTLKDGWGLEYERLVVAPGVDCKWGSPKGYDRAASEVMPHAWRAGEQTTLLKQQLMAMKDGGVVAIAVPTAPFRCPPGPYERASLIAHYLKAHKPRSKILILDANDKFSKQGLFMEAWKQLYPGMIEWVPISEDGAVSRVDPKSMTLFTELGEHKVDVANVVPSQSAGKIAGTVGLTDATGWCPIDQRTFESSRVQGIHVLGDAVMAGAMPKSASAANSQAKACALALVAYLCGKEPGAPSFHNTCYSLVAPEYGISVNAIYRLKDGVIAPVEGAGGVSPIAADPTFRAAEARYTQGWYDSITSDAFS